MVNSQITKFVTKSGNGAVVYVPSAWMDKKVSVSLIDVDISEELFYLFKPNLENVMGVYLYGSYARKEQLEDSDIDILVIADKKFELKPSKFDIRVIDINTMKEGIRRNPIIFYSIIHEAKPIINSHLLEELKNADKRLFNFSWFIRTSKSALGIARGFLELSKQNGIKYADNSSIYSIMLRARGLYIMLCIISGKKYTNEGFLVFLVNLGAVRELVDKMYDVYRAEKMNKTTSASIPIDGVYKIGLIIERAMKKYAKKKKS
ncbi:nucleotidyltransferase domain-containing protein [Candidatus Woesearchaeota archaeon]|nr:nucleotidyltransferase domain-containing protein [Candidatus Woesearchaeota archaeon]